MSLSSTHAGPGAGLGAAGVEGGNRGQPGPSPKEDSLGKTPLHPWTASSRRGDANWEHPGTAKGGGTMTLVSGKAQRALPRAGILSLDNSALGMPQER